MGELRRLFRKRGFYIIAAILILPLILFIIAVLIYWDLDTWRSIITIVYMLFTVAATSAIGYFAYRLNTTQYYVKLKAEAYVEVSKLVTDFQEKVFGILWPTPEEDETYSNLFSFIFLDLKKYKKKYQHSIPELHNQIDVLINNLNRHMEFFSKKSDFLINDNFKKNYNNERNRLADTIREFQSEIKKILYDND